MKIQKKITVVFTLFFVMALLAGGGICEAADAKNQDPEYYKAEKMQEIYAESESDIAPTGALAPENYQHNQRYASSNIYDVIDVSVWQNEIDWAKVKASGINYAFIRVGYRGYGTAGTLVEDTNFKKNLSNARNAGVQVGIYMYSQAVTVEEAIQEANFAVSRVKPYELALPVVMDYEYASVKGGLGGRLFEANLSRSQMTDICIAFCEQVKNSGFVPMVYGNRDMLELKLNSASLEGKYKIWLAEYNTTANYQGFYEFWQYSQKGTVDGINGFVDANFWYNGAKMDTSVPGGTTGGETTAPGGATGGETTAPGGETTAPGGATGGETQSPGQNVATQVAKPGKATITSAENKSGKKVALKWKKVSGAKGYQISYSTDKKFKSSKKITVKSSQLSKTITKLKKNKTYYFRVRAYKWKDDGSKLYGSYGSVKKVKIKK